MKQSRSDYLAVLLLGQAEPAWQVLEKALARGVEPSLLAVEVIGWALAEAGSLWDRQQASIAQEHQATQLCLQHLERLHWRSSKRPRLNRRALVCGVEGNHHLVGARIFAYLLEQDGWEVDFLGADMPGEAIVNQVRQRPPDLVSLSVALPPQLPTARRLIEKLEPLPVLVGGGAVELDPEGARSLRAHGLAGDAREGVALARQLVGIGRPTLAHYLEALGSRVQSLRLGRGWSQARLAQSCGLDRAYISALEHGKQNLTLGAVHKLAEALEVRLEDLVALA